MCFIEIASHGLAYCRYSQDLRYKGAIFENLAADILAKMGRKLYYFHKDSGLKIDFVMRYAGRSMLLEVKATTGNKKSAKTILNHPEK